MTAPTVDPLDDVHVEEVDTFGWFHKVGSECVAAPFRIGAWRALLLSKYPCPSCYPDRWRWVL